MALFMYFYVRSDPAIMDAFSVDILAVDMFRVRQRELSVYTDTICVSKLKLMRNIRIDG